MEKRLGNHHLALRIFGYIEFACCICCFVSASNWKSSNFGTKIPPNGELRAFTCTAIAAGQIIMLDKSKDNDKNCGGLMFIVIQNRKMFSVQRFAEKTTI